MRQGTAPAEPARAGLPFGRMVARRMVGAGARRVDRGAVVVASPPFLPEPVSLEWLRVVGDVGWLREWVRPGRQCGKQPNHPDDSQTNCRPDGNTLWTGQRHGIPPLACNIFRQAACRNRTSPASTAPMPHRLAAITGKRHVRCSNLRPAAGHPSPAAQGRNLGKPPRPRQSRGGREPPGGAEDGV
jgi:hypothetical protein